VNVETLFAALAAAPRLPGAACVGRHELFDLRDGIDPDRAEVEARALAICSACPALADCSAWLASLPARKRPTGVVAGVLRRPPAPRKAGRPRGLPPKTAVA
jgi:WhiB family transcriptional regulator, redox-sensing transcriptional regulator